MPAARRVGAETSQTRTQLLDAVEGLMVESGYAAVTYRAVARRAGVTAGLVQYYFPSLDDLLVATIRRRTDQGLDHLLRLLRERPDQPLRALWAFANDETAAALTMEFSALGHHRPSVRDEIHTHTRRVRDVQLAALTRAAPVDRTPAPAVLFLLSGIPKLVQMEAAFGIDTGHAEVAAMVEAFLDDAEPLAPSDRGPQTSRRRAG